MKDRKIGGKKRYAVIQLILGLIAIASLVFLASELNSKKKIKYVSVEGLHIIPDSLVIDGICRPILDSAGENLKLDIVRSAVMRNPFIKNAIVVRDGSERISIEAVERIPVAIIADTNGKLNYIDGEGVILPYDYIWKFPDLIIMRGMNLGKIGKRERREALSILNELRAPGRENLYYSISEIFYNRDSRDFSLLSSGYGLKIIFGRPEDTDIKIKKLLSFWVNELVNLDIKSIKYIDLRWSGQLVLSYS